jgi:hypothetical protein
MHPLTITSKSFNIVLTIMSEKLDDEPRLARPTMREQLLILGHTMLASTVSVPGPKSAAWSSTLAEFPHTPPMRLHANVAHFKDREVPAHRFRIENAIFNYDPDGNESMSVGIATANVDPLNGDPFAIDMHEKFTHVLADTRHVANYAAFMRDSQIRDLYAAEVKLAEPEVAELDVDEFAEPEEPRMKVTGRHTTFNYFTDTNLTARSSEPPLYL